MFNFGWTGLAAAVVALASVSAVEASHSAIPKLAVEQASAGPAAAGSAPAHASQPASTSGSDAEGRLPFVICEWLVIPPVGRYGRGPVHTDAIEALLVMGIWQPPKEGDGLTLPDGERREWRAVHCGENGSLYDSALGGGYAYAQVAWPTDDIVLLEAAGHSVVYVNGAPRAGDPYSTGGVRLPVQLRAGRNELLFHCQRGGLSARLVRPSAAALLNLSDCTLPDLRRGDPRPGLGAVVVINAAADWSDALELAVSRAGDAPLVTPVPPLPPLTVRKAQVALPAAEAGDGDTVACEIVLRRAGAGNAVLDRGNVTLGVRGDGQLRKVTYRSAIDGSVQYYAVLPAAAAAGQGTALVLTLHGAGVEAAGQAAAYAAKPWAHIVAPTNRRPFGFDWEDWGRLDALEALALAQRELPHDASRIYLTGHSMGGHGTWHLLILVAVKKHDDFVR